MPVRSLLMGAQASHMENLCAEETAPVPPSSHMEKNRGTRVQPCARAKIPACDSLEGHTGHR